MSATSKHSGTVDRVSGGPKLIADGVSLSMTADSWGRADLALVESLHLIAVHLSWESCQVGDYGWLSLIQPSGDCSPASAVSADDTTITLPTGKGTHYDPTVGAIHIEFWNDADDTLIEMAMIASVAGDVVTLASGVGNAHSTSANLRACYGHHTSMRGSNKIDGGMRFLGSGSDAIGSTHSMTSQIPSGMILGGRFKTSSDAATRKFAVNYKLRRPE